VDSPIANDDLLKQAVTHCHHRGNNTIDSRLPLGQRLRPLSDVPAATFANHQTERLQDTAQLVVDANAHVDQLVPSDQQRFSFMRIQTFDLHRLEPADADHFSQSTRVAAVGFVELHR
jgi:hypothetical protein